MVTILSMNYLCGATAGNLLCVVKLEGRELQLQIQAALCSEKHPSAHDRRSTTHVYNASLTRNRLQVELRSRLIVTVDI